MNWPKRNWIKVGLGVLVLVVIFFVKEWGRSQSNTALIGEIISPTVSPTPLETYTSSVVFSSTNDEDIIQVALDKKIIAEYGEYGFDTFTKNPQIVQRIMQLKRDFSTHEMAVSSPNKVYMLGGQRFLVLWGCVPLDCWSTEMTVVWGLDSDALYVNKQKDEHNYRYYGDPEYKFNYTYWGNPSDDMKRLMFKSLPPKYQD